MFTIYCSQETANGVVTTELCSTECYGLAQLFLLSLLDIQSNGRIPFDSKTKNEIFGGEGVFCSPGEPAIEVKVDEDDLIRLKINNSEFVFSICERR